MISHISLNNFKAFDELQLGLYPITLLLGPNNSGKSSILASLRLLAQTVESFDSQVPLLLNGIMGDFGTYKDIVYGNHRGRPIKLSVSIQSRLRESRLRKRTATHVTDSAWPSNECDTFTIALEYKYRTRRRELILRSTEIEVNNELMLATAYSVESERQLAERIGEKIVPSSIKSSLSRGLRIQNFTPELHMFYRAKQLEGSVLKEFITDQVRRNADLASYATRVIRSYLQKIDYIGAMRQSPSRTYRFTGERRNRIGFSGENTAGMLVMDSARGGERSLKVLDSIKDWLEKAVIASDVKIVPLSDRHYEIRVQHPITKEYQNLADVGQGNSQVLPVLVGGFHLLEGATYMVEEPEIHLHPRAQAELGDFFLELYQRRVQSIVETHSEYLVLRLQQHVANIQIPPEHIRIYYIYPKGDKKVVKVLRMNNKGRFIDEWPEGFFPERLDEAKKLSQLRFKHEHGLFRAPFWG